MFLMTQILATGKDSHADRATCSCERGNIYDSVLVMESQSASV